MFSFVVWWTAEENRILAALSAVLASRVKSFPMLGEGDRGRPPERNIASLNGRGFPGFSNW